MDNPVFLSLLQLVQMAPAFAEQVVVRAVARAGLDINTLTVVDVPKVLPHLEKSLKVFLTAERLSQRMQAIRSYFKIAS